MKLNRYFMHFSICFQWLITCLVTFNFIFSSLNWWQCLVQIFMFIKQCKMKEIINKCVSRINLHSLGLFFVITFKHKTRLPSNWCQFTVNSTISTAHMCVSNDDFLKYAHNSSSRICISSLRVCIEYLLFDRIGFY